MGFICMGKGRCLLAALRSLSGSLHSSWTLQHRSESGSMLINRQHTQIAECPTKALGASLRG